MTNCSNWTINRAIYETCVMDKNNNNDKDNKQNPSFSHLNKMNWSIQLFELHMQLRNSYKNSLKNIHIYDKSELIINWVFQYRLGANDWNDRNDAVISKMTWSWREQTKNGLIDKRFRGFSWRKKRWEQQN